MIFFIFIISVVMKRNIGVCQFASPLDVHNHSKPEVKSVIYFIFKYSLQVYHW